MPVKQVVKKENRSTSNEKKISIKKKFIRKINKLYMTDNHQKMKIHLFFKKKLFGNINYMFFF